MKNLKDYIRKNGIDIDNDERFETIKHNGIPTTYLVSSKGYVINTRYRGKYVQKMKEELNHGYKRVTLFIDGKRIHKRVHRLVAEAFIPNPKKLPVVDHIDNDKTNNDMSNLQWLTFEENTQKAYHDNLMLAGEDHPKSTLKNSTVRNISEMAISLKYSPQELCEKFNITGSVLSAIIHKRQWKKITVYYDFQPYIDKYGSNVIDKKTVILVAKLLSKKKYSNKLISIMTDVPVATVSDIKNRKSHSKITAKFNF